MLSSAQDVFAAHMRRRLLELQPTPVDIAARSRKRVADKKAEKQWLRLLTQLTNERGPWGVGVDAAVSFARRWTVLPLTPPVAESGIAASPSMLKFVPACALDLILCHACPVTSRPRSLVIVPAR